MKDRLLSVNIAAKNRLKAYPIEPSNTTTDVYVSHIFRFLLEQMYLSRNNYMRSDNGKLSALTCWEFLF